MSQFYSSRVLIQKLWHKIPFKLRASPLLRSIIRVLVIVKLFDLRLRFIANYKSRDLILTRFQSKIIMLSWPTYDWNIPLKQRPQHMAEAISRQEELAYIFSTRNVYDNLKSNQVLDHHLAITPFFWHFAKHVDVIHIYANDPNFKLRDFKKLEKLAIPVIYEVLDEFDVALQGGNSSEILQRHNYILKSKLVKKIVVTSSKLKVSLMETGYSEHKILLIPNACDTNHFALTKILEHEKPVIGYFGAFASWFDYTLLRNLASNNLNFLFKLVGVDYDGTLSKSQIIDLPNIEYLGVIPYDELPKWIDFDVAIVPFKINAITVATSPIKVYEYLACGIPVVSTRLPECEAIDLIQIASNEVEFAKEIAIAIANDSLKARLARREFATTQSWDARATDFVNALEMKEQLR